MLNLENKCSLFMGLTLGIFLVGGSIKVDVIENGQLVEWRRDSFDLLVSERAHRKIDEDNFRYHMDGIEFQSKISGIQREGNR